MRIASDLLQVGDLETPIYEKHDVCTLASDYCNAITLLGDAPLFRGHADSFPQAQPDC